MTEEYSRGSEWRRWDLHVHTASSYDYKYKGYDANEKLVSALKDNKIAAVAITDHFIIDKERIENLRTLAPDITFFPGVELRTDKGDSNIHVILIFSNEINLNNLADDFSAFRRGKSKNSDNDNKIYWDYNDITEFAKDHNAIISIHAGSKTSGIDDKISNALEVSQAIKEEYANTVSIFEMGKVKDLESYKKSVFPKIGIKPMIICSDNHDARDYNPVDKLWIKADPTFEGLQQILYEPEDRIYIGDIRPDIKSDYHIIDYIEFDDENFQKDRIYFNEGLNCIIGGKSTGKSILIQNLALKIDKDESEKNLEISKNKTFTANNVNICWKSNHSDNHKIIYIPQSYLNKLTDDFEEKTQIDSWVEDVLLQNKEIKNAHEEYNKDIQSLKQKMNHNILEFINKNDQYFKISEDLKVIGKETDIRGEIEKYKKEKDKLSKDCNISREDLDLYDYSLKQHKETLNDIINLKNDYISIKKLSSLIEAYDLKKINLTNNNLSHVKKYQDIFIKKINTDWFLKKKNILKRIKQIIKQKELKNIRYNIIIDNISPKIETNKSIVLLTSKILEEEQKLKILLEKEKLLKEIANERDKLLEELISYVQEYKNVNYKYIEIVNSCDMCKKEDISFSAIVKFKIKTFVEKINSVYKNNCSEFKKFFNADSFEEKNYTKDSLKIFLNNTLLNKFLLKVDTSMEEAIRIVLDNYYNISYEVTMGSDKITYMSPGKKAIVLLKILISLTDAKYPILIDQPEDDLDNRSIYNDLAKFIKQKKKERQIILVTHNANIVVGADAEEVIIANQQGEDSPNKSKKFEYRSGSIENIYPKKDESGNIEKGILNEKGIQQQICDILEGGEKAFELRKNKYHV